MERVKVLILTDHGIHSPVESIYHLAQSLLKREEIESIDVVSRGVDQNKSFFEKAGNQVCWAIPVNDNFQYTPNGSAYKVSLRQIMPADYDIVMLRLPRSNSIDFFKKIGETIPPYKIVNQPKGIIETGSKAFLHKFPELCPEMESVFSIEQIKVFKSRFPIVLKPFNSSGGRGILRLEGNLVSTEGKQFGWEEYLPTLEKNVEKGYLAMEFLNNVEKGDKRIIVANGITVAAVLRIPAEGNWLCNASMGGSSHIAEPDEDEIAMVEKVTPILLEKGIALFGMDTLVGNDGKRVLSELNTSCVNGIYPAEVASGQPVVQNTADLLWEYMKKQLSKNGENPIHP